MHYLSLYHSIILCIQYLPALVHLTPGTCFEIVLEEIIQPAVSSISPKHIEPVSYHNTGRATVVDANEGQGDEIRGQRGGEEKRKERVTHLRGPGMLP